MRNTLAPYVSAAPHEVYPSRTPIQWVSFDTVWVYIATQKLEIHGFKKYLVNKQAITAKNHWSNILYDPSHLCSTQLNADMVGTSKCRARQAEVHLAEQPLKGSMVV